MKGFLIDIDGVIYQNDALIPGADQTLKWLDEQKVPHLFVTNTTSKPLSKIVQKLNEFGLPVKASQIITPLIATQLFLKNNIERGDKVALFVPEASAQDLADFDQLDIGDEESYGQVAALVVGDLGYDWSFEKLNSAFRILMASERCQLIALGMTRYFKSGSGLQMDVGPFVQALAFASGKSPMVLGKPSKSFFNLASETMGLSCKDLVMIGDDAVSDVQAAQEAGIRGMLVKTGKYRDSDLQKVQPDCVLDSIVDLPRIC